MNLLYFSKKKNKGDESLHIMEEKLETTLQNQFKQ